MKVKISTSSLIGSTHHLTGVIKIIILSLIIITLYTKSTSALTYQDSVDVSFTFAPTLSISLSSSNISIDSLSPGNYAHSNTVAINVSTNNVYGYTLTAKVGDDGGASGTSASSDLVNTPTNTSFTSLNDTDSQRLSDISPAKWGYTTASSIQDATTRYSGLLYGTDTVINVTKNVTGTALNTYPGTSTTRFTIGANASQEQMAGDYTNIITFTAVSNIVAPTLCNASGTTITQIGCMQDITEDNKDAIMASMVMDKAYRLYDSRDGQSYLVALARDSNVWMAQNLKLGKDVNSIGLTAEDSDTGPGGFTLNGKRSNRVFSHTTVDGVTFQNNSSQFYCSEDYGCYYNWYTATAGSGTTAISSGNVEHSICPSGWTLPTGGNQGQFATLYSYYGSTEEMLVDNPAVAKDNIASNVPGFLLGGYINASGDSHSVAYGVYWSGTTNGPQRAFNLKFTQNTTTIDHDYKFLGYSVRCILR